MATPSPRRFATNALPGVPAELPALARLAVPLALTSLAQMSMGVMDTVMAGRLGAEALAGIALGGNMFWPILLLMMGMLQVVVPVVSQLRGARRTDEVASVVRQALWLALVSAVVIISVVRNPEPVYRLLGVDPVAAAISVPYLEAVSWGIPGLTAYLALRYLAEGYGWTRPALVITLGALALKFPLNWVFMYGAGPVEGLGGVGAGVATAIIHWLQLAAILWVVTRPRLRETGWYQRFEWPDPARLKQLVSVGLPIGLSHFAEISLFALTTLLVGRFGADAVASHVIAMNVGGIVFMAPMALGNAATIQVGFHVGGRALRRATATCRVAMAGSLTLATLGGLLVFTLRDGVAALYTPDAAVQALAVQLMLYVVIFQLFDATQATAMGALRGYKDTRVPMLLAMTSYWLVALPLGCTLGFGWLPGVEPFGIHGFWYGLIGGLAVAALLLNLRLWHVSGRARTVRRLARA